jgi:SAM-dependent methyltransferase
MNLFPYRELRYYSFGLRVGFSNLLHNGFAIGVKRTVGKISQPINWYTRFPEYYYFDHAIARHLTALGPGVRAKILDIGSPKTLGLYLACNTEAEVILTDISELNIDEYRPIWRSLSRGAKGHATFELQDARALNITDVQFDVVYSMSVVEHVHGEAGDSEAVREMIRVLKPGGLFVISVPFGKKYMEQEIVGLAGAVRPTNDQQSYFFQRIYDEPAFTSRIIKAAAGLEDVRLTTIWRKRLFLHRAYASFGHTARGFVGFINPFLSAIGNESCEGMKRDFAINYGSQHSLRDIYGDLIMTGVKKAGR